MIKRIFLNAGHSIKEPGAVANNKIESDEVMIIRDCLLPMLETCGFEVYKVPDNLDLSKSIKWVNDKSQSVNDGLALSIHLNAGGGKGAETYYYSGSNTSKKIATDLVNEYCQYTGLKNRGAKKDTSTRHKRLGWIRDTTPWSCLMEAYFIEEDIVPDYQKTAMGIYLGICKVFKTDPIVISPETGIKKQLKNIVEDINKVIEEL